MLTTSSSGAANQYLRPEYLTPLPTTLDAKKSPLALLAQTCSQIGADPPAVVPSSHKSSSLNATSSSNNNNHVTHSSLSSGKSKSSGTSGNYSTKSILHQEPTNSNTNPKRRSASPSSERSLKKSSHCQQQRHQPESIPLPMSPSNEVTLSSSSTVSPPLINTMLSTTPAPTTFLENDKPHHQRPKTPSHGSNPKASTPNPHNPSPPSSSSSSSSSFLNPSNKSPPTGSNLSLSETSTSTNAILSGAKLNLTGSSSMDLGLKHGMPFPLPPTSGTGIPPYLQSYARLKAASGGSMESMALCRDPFCTGCHLGTHGLNFHGGIKGTCPGGCMGCEHHKGQSFRSGPHFGHPILPGLPLPPSLAAFYASSQGAYSSALQSLQPYVCNWFVGESYCGKRFSASDDLLQHLRTHTTLGGGSNGINQEAVQGLAAALAAGYSPSFLGSPSSHALLGASHGILNRTYPTPPLSPLNSSRFHPYATGSKGSSSAINGSALSGHSSPSASMTSSFFPSGFPLSHPAFGPYYPYSLYGPRLGGTGFLHP